MAAGSIIIDLLMRTGSFETDSKRAEKRLRDMDKEFKRVGTVIGTAIAAGAGIAVVALKSTINEMDELSKTAQRVGVPTEELSRLAYAGDLADVSLSDLQSSLGKLIKSMGDAEKETSTQGRILDALGIQTIDPLTGKFRSATEVLYDFADAFKEQKGSPEIIAAGLQIFGRSFQNIIPLIKDGSAGLREMGLESDILGKTLSTEAGRGAEAFNDNLTRLKSATGGLAMQVATDLLPDLEHLTDEFVNLVTEGDGISTLAHDIAQGFRFIGSAAESTITLVSGVTTVIGGLLEQMAGFYDIAESLTTLDFEARDKGAQRYRKGGAQVNTGADRLLNPKGANGLFNGGALTLPASAYTGPLLTPSKSVEDAMFAQEVAAEKARREHAKRLREALGDIPKDPKTPKLSDAEKEAKKLQDAYGDLVASQLEQIALFGDTTEAAKVRYEFEYGALSKLTEAERQKLGINKEQAIANAEYMDQLADTAALEGVWADAHDEATQGMIDSWSKTTDELSVFAEQAGRNMQDKFADFLFDPFEDGLDGMLKGFGDILRRMAAEMIASQVFDAIGAWGKANIGSGGWAGALASIASNFGGKRSGGGGVDGSKLYEVGENGRPEMFEQNGKTYLIPGGDGRVLPATHGMSAPAGYGSGAAGGFQKIVIENKGQPMRSTGAQMESGPGGMKQLRVFVENIVAEGGSRRGNPIHTMLQNRQRMRSGVPVGG